MSRRILLWSITSALAGFLFGFDTVVISGAEQKIFTHWIFAALLTSFFPKMVSAFAPGYVFGFFAGMMVLQLVWVKTMMIETKGASLERIQERLRAA
jgi:hypothetical protein